MFAGCIAYAVLLCVLSVAIEGLRCQGYNGKKNQGSRYVVRSSLAPVFILMFGVGILMFCVFSVSWLLRNPSSTMAELILTLAFASVGLLFTVFSCHWKIIVDGSMIEVYRFFRVAYASDISGISKMRFRYGRGFALYDTSDKKIIFVKPISDNYIKFAKMLKDNGKLYIK